MLPLSGHQLHKNNDTTITGSTGEKRTIAELGKKYGKSAAQIILRWHIQDGNIVIPGSKNADHIKSNFDLFDFALTEKEMKRLLGVWMEVQLLF